MLNKNELKNLIYIQENEHCNEQTIKGLFRSIVEPILENPVESLVLLRLEDKSKKDFDSIIKRLGFSSAIVYDYSNSDISDKFENVLDKNIWENTEFVYILSERFGAAFIFDYKDSELDGFASYYIMHNSKHLVDVMDIINNNSKIDLHNYDLKWRPDRRENDLLNSSIRKIVSNLNEMNQEVMISELEKEQIVQSEDAVKELEFMTKKSSYVAHEMKNLLSICNLYSDIISKRFDKIEYKDSETENSVKNAHNCICKALQMCINVLLDFRSMNKVQLNQYNLKDLIQKAVDLSKIYANEKIKINNQCNENIKILVDEIKFITVVINLIKNAAEVMDSKGEITLSSTNNDKNVKIIISNTGKPIPDEMKEKIFKEGFTTKESGNGLGLKICRKTLEAQQGSLELKKSDEKSTDFELTLLKG